MISWGTRRCIQPCDFPPLHNSFHWQTDPCRHWPEFDPRVLGLAVKEIVKTLEQLWLALFSSLMGSRFAGFRVLQTAEDLISGDPIAKSQAEAWSLSKSGPRWAVRTRVGALRVNLSPFVVGRNSAARALSQEPALGSGIELFGELGCWLWNPPSFWLRPLTSTASVLWV